MSNIAAELELDKVIPMNTIKKDEEEKVEMEDFFATSAEDLENFDRNAWSKGDGLKMPSFKYVTEKLEGLDSGLYLFAGKSNHGKSAIMMNMLYDACSNPENKLFGLYYSLDDSKNEIIPRLIAMDQRINIGVAAKPQRYQNMIDEAYKNANEFDIPDNVLDYEEQLRKRQIGLDNLKQNVNKLKIEDSNKIKNSDDMHKHIEMVLTYLRAIDPEYKIIIAIDSINDVRLTYKPNDNDILAEIARVVKEWTVEFDCPIFASTHIRKLNGNRRPTLEDLKDSTVLVYEASVVFIVFNDVSENKQAANIYQMVPGEEFKRPILELDWAKNKKSSFKGRSFCYFSPEHSKAIECDEEAIKRYEALIYSA